MLFRRAALGLLSAALVLTAAGMAGFYPSPALAAPGESAIESLTDYKLGAGDKVRVIVYGEEALSGEFVVSSTGKVSMPLVGEVSAAGLTVTAFQTTVQDALRDGYLKDPRVSAEVLNYRPFYILGEVEKPGEYPYTNGLSVLNAVATAGGFTYRANKGQVFIRRGADTTERREQLTPSVKVLPGDTIRIGERFF